MMFSKKPWSLLLLLSVINNCSVIVSAFAAPHGRTVTWFPPSCCRWSGHGPQQRSLHSATLGTSTSDVHNNGDSGTPLQQSNNPSLPNLFPILATTLTNLGFSTPTPIQLASATTCETQDCNLLLIAPTGSGKTLAYLLPALSKAIRHDGTVLVVAPTRELAAQLQRDTIAILGIQNAEEQTIAETVVLVVRGVPSPTDVVNAAVIIGTPLELLQVLTSVQGAREFLAPDALRALILDEVDVLLPLPPKEFRTNLDRSPRSNNNSKRSTNKNAAEMERRRQQEEKQKLAQTRKLNAAKRAGIELTSDNKQIVVPTELLLRFIATIRATTTNQISDGADGTSTTATITTPPQILAGSATASRRTLDRLNRAMRAASAVANMDFESIWAKDVIVCRPEEQVENDTIAPSTTTTTSTGDNNDDDDEDYDSMDGVIIANEGTMSQQQQQHQHTIRAVTVPSQVSHRYILLSKESASSADAVLAAVAQIANRLKPKSALVFLCGEFSKTNSMSKEVVRKPIIRGKTSEARRNQKREFDKKASAAAMSSSAGTSSTRSSTESSSALSARKTCDILASYGIEAEPLHVVLGLEHNAKSTTDEDEEPPPFLVTFEGSARGLHFDAVDVVFVVGRPTSAASYLHLAGRVGRSGIISNGGGSPGVMIHPGTVISLCTKGSATELEKWTKQIGGTNLEELVLE